MLLLQHTPVIPSRYLTRIDIIRDTPQKITVASTEVLLDFCTKDTFLQTVPGRLSMTLRNFQKRLPCRGLVKKSATMSPVGQYSALNSPLVIQSESNEEVPNVNVLCPTPT